MQPQRLASLSGSDLEGGAPPDEAARRKALTMIRKLAAALLLSLAPLATAVEVPMFSTTLDDLGPARVLSHQLQFPAEYHGPVHVAVDLELAGGQVRTVRLQVPEGLLDWSPGYISHSYHFEANGHRWYLGEQALWEPGLVLHVEPKVYLTQVRLDPTGQRLEVFLDSEVFQVVGRDQRRRAAFAALHADR